jgi:hypothetical protein
VTPCPLGELESAAEATAGRGLTFRLPNLVATLERA